jgi:hypothetical protein
MAVKTGQQATTTSAAALPSVAFSYGPVTMKAPSTNAAPVEIGPSGVTAGSGFVLEPGDSVTLAAPNLNQLYLIGANTSDKITWIGF